jgi:DnaJ-class molecular chaperone
MMNYPNAYHLYRNCKVCGGDGVIVDPSSLPENPQNVPCPDCNGEGKIIQMTLSVLGDAFAALDEKVQEVISKVSKIQKDIDYIKKKIDKEMP